MKLARRSAAFGTNRKGFIQPTEFIVSGRGGIVSSTYSSSPVGRLDPNDALQLTKMLAERKSGG
ncbi:MAG: hypothetical protein U5O39_10725 [Gammaproteobacteria bacterium]|nr:hypothetical protein [Gammaproteobacteria bacterium]